MKDFTDLVLWIGRRDGSYFCRHYPLNPNKPLLRIPYEGNRYEIDLTKTHRLRGWYPWVRMNWKNPFWIIRYFYILGTRKVALAIFRQPHETAEYGPDVSEWPIVYPKTRLDVKVTEDGEYPQLVKAKLRSPLAERALRKRRFKESGFSGRTVVYMVIFFILIMVVLYLGGFIQIGSGGR